MVANFVIATIGIVREKTDFFAPARNTAIVIVVVAFAIPTIRGKIAVVRLATKVAFARATRKSAVDEVRANVACASAIRPTIIRVCML